MDIRKEVQCPICLGENMPSQLAFRLRDNNFLLLCTISVLKALLLLIEIGCSYSVDVRVFYNYLLQMLKLYRTELESSRPLHRSPLVLHQIRAGRPLPVPSLAFAGVVVGEGPLPV
jgi:hypothetical protein